MEKLQQDEKSQANTGLGSETGTRSGNTHAMYEDPRYISLAELSEYKPYSVFWTVAAHAFTANIERLAKGEPRYFLEAAMSHHFVLSILAEKAYEVTGMTPEEFEDAQFDRYEQIFGKSAR